MSPLFREKEAFIQAGVEWGIAHPGTCACGKKLSSYNVGYKALRASVLSPRFESRNPDQEKKMGHLKRALGAYMPEHDEELAGNLAKMMQAAHDAGIEAEATESPADRVNRLGAEMACALDDYDGGNFHAIIQPASKTCRPVSIIAPDFYEDSHSDAKLLALGQEFDRRQSAYLDANARCDDALSAFDDWAASVGLAYASQDWLERREAECGPAIEAADELARAVDVIANAIRETQAATAAGIFVKARILPFDLGKQADHSKPMRDWDWDEECLHRFITEVHRFATASGKTTTMQQSHSPFYPVLGADEARKALEPMEHPWTRARRLSKQLSHVLAECERSDWFAHVLPAGRSPNVFFGALSKSEPPGELPVDTVNRLAWELSEALNSWNNGTFQAMVIPSSRGGNTVMFANLRSWD